MRSGPEDAQPSPTPHACVRALDGGRATRLDVRAQPGARRAGFAGFWNGVPKIAVSAPPEDGRANAEIAAQIALLFGLRTSAVSQIAGATSRAKSFRLECEAVRVATRLTELERERTESRDHT